MNWLKKGPELKLSEIKVPDFLFDLYYDLKERRLLPLIALLLVAIIAVPVLLNQAASSEPDDAPTAVAPEADVSSAPGSNLVVAKAAPGLRDYRRRLKHANALDPFRQPQSGSGGDKSPSPEVSSASDEASSSPSFEESSLPALPPTESAPSATYPGDGSDDSSGGASSGGTSAKYATTSIDTRIVSVPHSGGSAKPKAEVRRNLPELTMLPSRAKPAAVFMGTSADGKKALLLVSSDVKSVFGDGQCVVGSEVCQLLALKKGLPQTFVYGPQGRTYRIEILAIEQTFSATPRRASLGAPKKGKGEGGTDQSATPGRQPETRSPGGAG